MICALLTCTAACSNACLAQPVTAKNYDALVPQGKEVDAIYGDFALTSQSAKAVLALPSAARHANMTVRDVGGCLIDFAARDFESDQLSAFYPGKRKYPFSVMDAKPGVVVMTSKGTATRPRCDVRYQLSADLPVVEVTSIWTNTTQSDVTVVLEDDLRADGGKEDMVKSPNGTHDLFYFHDIFWQQAYAIRAPGYAIRCNSNSRVCSLNYEKQGESDPTLKPGESFEFKRQIVVGKDLPEVLAVVDELGGQPRPSAAKIRMIGFGDTPIPGARVTFRSADGERGTTITDAEGMIRPRLPVGDYTFDISAAGIDVFQPNVMRFRVHEGTTESIFRFEGFRTGAVSVVITDDNGTSIPAKVQFTGNGDTPTPNWGPETAEHFVRNVAYTSDGTFDTLLAEGTYDVIVSRGPEYDAVFTKLEIKAGENTELKATLKHSVATPKWVSSDFHSHSSPSGDNTGSQRGRVLNLAAEHIEFAPCTEHNRIDTYDDDIAALNLQSFLATVTGMELTGQPLPLNHQNVFPLKHKPRTQDGGGPVTDSSPETQVERIALWDNRSEKVVQQNHPDIGWLFYDKNGDGNPDGGYSRSFPFINVMEIHPIDRILTLQRFDHRNGKPFGNNRMLNWLQLLNQGFRIYGVVNTDAHYNFHGSGPLRNWIHSSTDNPGDIDPMEMVRATNTGQLIMSNGPYLEAAFETAESESAVPCGGDIEASDGKVDVHIKAQCANWLDVDTVFLLVNGKPAPGLTFTRKEHPELFRDRSSGPLRFEHAVQLTLKEDSHIVVVTGHRTETLGDVAGPSWGTDHPAALTNPVFVDVDGNGFSANKDTLGFPLPVKFGSEK